LVFIADSLHKNRTVPQTYFANEACYLEHDRSGSLLKPIAQANQATSTGGSNPQLVAKSPDVEKVPQRAKSRDQAGKAVFCSRKSSGTESMLFDAFDY